MERILYPFFLFVLIIQYGDTITLSETIAPFDKNRAKWNDSLFWRPCYLGRNSEDAIKTLANCKTLDELLEYVPGRGTYNHSWIRDLDLGVQQFDTYGFVQENAEQESKRVNINGLIHNDSIIFGFITVAGKIQYYKEDRLFLQNYLAQHNSFYNTEYNYPDLIDAVEKEEIIQIACGNGADYYSDEAKIMLQSIKDANKKPLNMFIRSIIPEIQAYGVIGLMALKDRGVSLTADENKITEYLLERNSEIRMCMTCVSGKKTLQFAVDYWLKMIHSEDYEVISGKFSKIEN